MVRNDEVAGSIPTSSTKTNHLQATFSNQVPITSQKDFRETQGFERV